jgi:transposase
MMGRPTKLDAQIVSRIVDLVRAGNFLETAAATCGIHRATLYRWLERGEAQRMGPYRDFYVALTTAQAESEARDLLIITRAASEDWRASAWRLERRYPRRYGPQVAITLRQELDSLLGTLRDRLPAEIYQEVMNAIVFEDDQIKELE